MSNVQNSGVKTSDKEVVKVAHYLLWIDGVIDESRQSQLAAEAGFVEATQYYDYVIAKFASLPSRFSVRDQDRFRYLDPHRFVLATDVHATHLEINFNPTEVQLEKLRRFRDQLRIASANHQ